jgi:hypothetical protein
MSRPSPGGEGHDGRDQGRGDPRGDAARDGPPGRAERERRAKVINAEGEFQAAGKLREASRILSESPAALHLRYLQTMAELGPGAQSTIVFPLPIDLLRPFLGDVAQAAGTIVVDASRG